MPTILRDDENPVEKAQLSARGRSNHRALYTAPAPAIDNRYLTLRIKFLVRHRLDSMDTLLTIFYLFCNI